MREITIAGIILIAIIVMFGTTILIGNIINLSTGLFRNEMKYQENKGKLCSVSGCNGKARAKGLCLKCYLKMIKKVEK